MCFGCRYHSKQAIGSNIEIGLGAVVDVALAYFRSGQSWDEAILNKDEHQHLPYIRNVGGSADVSISLWLCMRIICRVHNALIVSSRAYERPVHFELESLLVCYTILHPE